MLSAHASIKAQDALATLRAVNNGFSGGDAYEKFVKDFSSIAFASEQSR